MKINMTIELDLSDNDDNDLHEMLCRQLCDAGIVDVDIEAAVTNGHLMQQNPLRPGDKSKSPVSATYELEGIFSKGGITPAK